MARGKHAGKDNTFFGDENYYRRNRYNDIADEKDNNHFNNSDERMNVYLNDRDGRNYPDNYSNNYQDDEESDTYDDEYYDDEESGFNVKKLLFILLIIALIIIVLIFLFKNVFGKKEKSNLSNTASNSIAMEAQYEGYKVLGQIKIDKLGITQYILDSTEDKALQKGVGKIYGGSLNNYGNFCIVGHNFTDIFAGLEKLEEGETFTIVDKKMEETKYKVTKKYFVDPDNLECLTQNDNKIEITLITCKDGATQRLVIKAEKSN